MYHVGVSNIFELLDDENDEEGKKKVVSSTPVKSDAVSVKGKTAATTGKEHPRKTEPPPPAKVASPLKEKSDKRPSKPETEKPSGERPPRRNRAPRAEGSAPSGEKPVERMDSRPEKGERPPRMMTDGGRGKRENKDKEFQARPNKRSYDRKSGTGRGKEIKKGGGGRGNWGKGSEEVWEEVGAEKQDGEEVKSAEVESTPKKEEAESAPVSKEVEEERKKKEEDEKKRKEEEEKEAKMMTLEDYRKKQEAKKTKTSIIPDLPAPRQAGDGEEQQKWAEFTPFKREDETETNGDEEKDASCLDSKKEKKKAKKQAVPVTTVLRVQPPKKPRAGKLDRPDRPDRPSDASSSSSPSDRRNFKDSPRGGKRRAGTSAPDVRDASSFPALNPKT